MAIKSCVAQALSAEQTASPLCAFMHEPARPEVAEISVVEGMHTELLDGVRKGARLFLREKAAMGFRSTGVVENRNVSSGRGVGYCRGPHGRFPQLCGFSEWRRLVRHCFAKPPSAMHNEEVIFTYLIPSKR